MHIDIAGSRRVPTFGAISDYVLTKHSLPLPERKPNMSENRNDSKIFGELGSPPPATNGNRSSSIAPCGLFSYCSCDGLIKCFLLLKN